MRHPPFFSSLIHGQLCSVHRLRGPTFRVLISAGAAPPAGVATLPLGLGADPLIAFLGPVIPPPPRPGSVEARCVSQPPPGGTVSSSKGMEDASLALRLGSRGWPVCCPALLIPPRRHSPLCPSIVCAPEMLPAGIAFPSPLREALAFVLTPTHIPAPRVLAFPPPNASPAPPFSLSIPPLSEACLHRHWLSHPPATLRPLCCRPLPWDIGLSSLKLRCNPALVYSPAPPPPPGGLPPPVHRVTVPAPSPVRQGPCGIRSHSPLTADHPLFPAPIHTASTTCLLPKLANISGYFPFLLPRDPTVVLGLQDSV